MSEIQTERRFENLTVTVEGVIGRIAGQPSEGIPEMNFLLVSLDNEDQKYLAVTEEGSNKVVLIEADDEEEAGELMIEHVGSKLNLTPMTK